jgi:hypothetical protein
VGAIDKVFWLTGGPRGLRIASKSVLFWVYTPVRRKMDLSQMSDQELQRLVDRARRELAERKLERVSKFRYVLDSRLIDGTRYTKEMKPCGNPKCKRCRERREYHGPVYKSYSWNSE